MTVLNRLTQACSLFRVSNHGEMLHFALLTQGDANRQISDLKFKLVKSEQEVTALEQNVRNAPSCPTCYSYVHYREAHELTAARSHLVFLGSTHDAALLVSPEYLRGWNKVDLSWHEIVKCVKHHEMKTIRFC